MGESYVEMVKSLLAKGGYGPMNDVLYWLVYAIEAAEADNKALDRRLREIEGGGEKTADGARCPRCGRSEWVPSTTYPGHRACSCGEHYTVTNTPRLTPSPPAQVGGEALPDCMMPDGADPCVAFQKLEADHRALQERVRELDVIKEAATNLLYNSVYSENWDALRTALNKESTADD